MHIYGDNRMKHILLKLVILIAAKKLYLKCLFVAVLMKNKISDILINKLIPNTINIPYVSCIMKDT